MHLLLQILVKVFKCIGACPQSLRSSGLENFIIVCTVTPIILNSSRRKNYVQIAGGVCITEVNGIVIDRWYPGFANTPNLAYFMPKLFR